MQSRGTKFRIALDRLRDEHGVYCSTCDYWWDYDRSCGLTLEFKSGSDWCEDWKAKDE